MLTGFSVKASSFSMMTACENLEVMLSSWSKGQSSGLFLWIVENDTSETLLPSAPPGRTIDCVDHVLVPAGGVEGGTPSSTAVAFGLHLHLVRMFVFFRAILRFPSMSPRTCVLALLWGRLEDVGAEMRNLQLMSWVSGAKNCTFLGTADEKKGSARDGTQCTTRLHTPSLELSRPYSLLRLHSIKTRSQPVAFKR